MLSYTCLTQQLMQAQQHKHTLTSFVHGLQPGKGLGLSGGSNVISSSEHNSKDWNSLAAPMTSAYTHQWRSAGECVSFAAGL